MATLKYTYLQTGEHYHGVPARDLTDEDFAALDEEQQTAVVEGALFREATAKEVQAAAKEAKAEAKEAQASAPDPAPAAPPANDKTTG